MKRLLLMVLLALLLVPAAAWSLDTDFEDGFQANGVGKNWTAYDYDGTPPAPTYADETTIKNEGSHSQKVDATGCEGGVYYQLNTAAGRTYDVSVWVHCANAQQAYLAVDANGGTVASAQTNWVTNNTAGTWEQLTVRVQATGTKVTAFCDAWDCVTYFDHLTLTEFVPEFDPNYSLGPVPYEIWAESVYWQKTLGDVGPGNAIGHAQLLIDGNKSIISEGQGGVLLYADEMVNETAFVKSTPYLAYFFDWTDPGWPDTSNYSTKAATIINGVMYSQDMHMRIHKCIPWEGEWSEPGIETGRVESDCTGLVTDGTYLYGSDNPQAATNNSESKIYKWSIDPVTKDINPTPVWVVTIPAPKSWLVSIGYYNGKLYAAEGFQGRNIYEIDCATGAYQTILNNDNLIPQAVGSNPDGTPTTWYMGQIARCGDTLVLAGWSGHITIWKQQAGVWTLYSCNRWYPIFYPGDHALRMHTDTQYFLGLSLKAGPDGNAKYAWVSTSNYVNFFDLDPQWTSVSLGEARKLKNGYPNGVLNSVVTKVGTGEYWIEDQGRSAGCRVVGTIDPTAVGKLVTMTGSMDTNTAGEKSFTPNIAPTIGAVADPAIKPVYVSGKNLVGAGGTGLATDGMLVKITGKVNLFIEEVEGVQVVHVYVDDGSALATDREGITGVEVVVGDWTQTTGFEFLMGPAKAEVTGILRLVKATDGTIVRKIEPLTNADAVFSAL